MKPISVIVPALDEEERIAGCLASLANQSLPRGMYEIIVVDGGSTDGTRRVAAAMADRVFVQRRSGIGGARRDGAEAAEGRILVFTDADTRCPPDWLERIHAACTVRGYAVCTGPVRFSRPTLCSCVTRLWRGYYRLLHPFGFYWLIGSNCAVRREAYERSGGHREISILEDYDLSLRLQGERCCYDPHIAVVTSARRMTGVLGYAVTYLRGYCHYHLGRDERALLHYRRPAPRLPQAEIRQRIDDLRQWIGAAGLRLP
ncbi:glycosyltransferase [Methanofollis fontis]|uniref:glycosyltransferase n=1 Tax=Methanofollis fontis TaxID=2052832 RepID=UPI0013EE8E86|nr:glycosyltransferase [Methanofollis fontis]